MSPHIVYMFILSGGFYMRGDVYSWHVVVLWDVGVGGREAGEMGLASLSVQDLGWEEGLRNAVPFVSFVERGDLG